MIDEVTGRKTRELEWQNALHMVGWFDSIEEMHAIADQYHGAIGLAMSPKGWSIVKRSR